MRQQTRELALASVLGALAVLFLFLGGVLPLALYACPLLASACLLPVREEDFDDVPSLVQETDHDQILYEPSVTELMDQLIPQYLIGMIYSALVQSFASEQCARMNAMDSATRNANEMLDKLSHELNRARQSAITNELAEIIAGADALKG